MAASHAGTHGPDTLVLSTRGRSVPAGLSKMLRKTTSPLAVTDLLLGRLGNQIDVIGQMPPTPQPATTALATEQSVAASGCCGQLSTCSSRSYPRPLGRKTVTQRRLQRPAPTLPKQGGRYRRPLERPVRRHCAPLTRGASESNACLVLSANPCRLRNAGSTNPKLLVM